MTEFFFLNSINNTPFRLTVTIRKVKKHLYSIRGTVDSFFYYYSGHTNFNYLNILITLFEKNKSLIQRKNSIREEFIATILAKNSLLTSNGLNGSGLSSLHNYNQNWYRESLWNPKIELTKDNFYIDVIWGMYKDKIIRDNRLKLKSFSNAIYD